MDGDLTELTQVIACSQAIQHFKLYCTCYDRRRTDLLRAHRIGPHAKYKSKQRWHEEQ